MWTTDINMAMGNCPLRPRSDWDLLAECRFHLPAHLHSLVVAVHFHI